MNRKYVCIDFKSKLKPEEMLRLLRERFPAAKWHGSDNETQGPYLSSLTKNKPQLKIFFEEEGNRFCMNFANLGLDGQELESYKSDFVAFVQEQVLPCIVTVGSEMV